MASGRYNERMEDANQQPSTSAPPLSHPARFLLLVGRALLLRCPFCGRGKLFRGFFAMHDNCPVCGKSFQREPGFFLGSIYFNYGLTALIVAIAYPVLLFGFGLQEWENQLLVGAALFTLICPILFFRHARSLWLGFDQFADPREQYEPEDKA
jgi:uncharacterized protein (DUF983 family)